MIKLPREIVMQLAEELTGLVKDLETSEQTKEVIEANLKIQLEIDKRQAHINALTREIEDLTAKLLPVPEHKIVDEERIEALSQMLVLSGYFKKVVDENGEYLEETGAYDEVVQPETTTESVAEPVVETVEETTVETPEDNEPVVETVEETNQEEVQIEPEETPEPISAVEEV